MSLPKSHQEIMALRELALEDLMAVSDEQLRREAIEEGDDVSALTTELRSALRRTIGQTLRQRLVEAKQRLDLRAGAIKHATYPAFETLKQRIENVFKSTPELGLAFREGRKQSEADWQTLYDDLIDLGALDREEEDR